MVPKKSGEYPEYRVCVNGIIDKSTFKPNKDNWQNSYLSDESRSRSTIKLNPGKNLISIVSEAPEVPDVEFIKCSSSALNSDISDLKYNQYVADIKSWEKEYVPQRILSDTSNVMVRGTAGQEFTYKLDLPIYYTTYKTFSFISGQNVSIKTTTTNGYEHIIELFSSSNPEAYTWATLVEL